MDRMRAMAAPCWLRAVVTRMRGAVKCSFPYPHPRPHCRIMASDPLLQPYDLKHLRLRNRIMTTAHEPAYTEDGLPKDRYRAYHEERAKGGVAMVMTAGSASVSRDSPPAFGNVLAWKDEVVPWMARLAEACHGHGEAGGISRTAEDREGGS